MVKKFIDPRNSISFKLVHRSQRDVRINDENAGDLVLQPMQPSRNLQKRGFKPNLDFNIQEEEQEEETGNVDENEKVDKSQYGIYFHDEYDYLKHLKEVGEDPNGLIFNAQEIERQRESGIQFLDKSDAIALDGYTNSRPNAFKLSSDVFASTQEMDVGLMNQDASLGLRLDIDPEVREVFTALDDDDYVENELDDDFFQAINSEQVPEKYQSLLNEHDELYDNFDENEESWLTEFKRFQKHKAVSQNNRNDDTNSDGSYESFEIGSKSKSRKAASSAFSMTSSSMFRNDKLALLDDQFDQLIAAEYSDEEMGELDAEDDRVLGDADLNDPMLDGLYDSFLENLQIIGSRRRLVTRNPQESLDAVRKELKEEAKALVDRYGIEEDFVEGDFRMPEPKKKSEWDVETILSTTSNIYNRPKLIHEISKGVPKFKLSRGVPQVIVEEEGSESEVSDQTERPACINKGAARPPKESKEEKKARKNAVKEERKSRRLSKKATRSAFQNEQANQLKQLPNLKLQAHSVALE